MTLQLSNSGPDPVGIARLLKGYNGIPTEITVHNYLERYQLTKEGVFVNNLGTWEIFSDKFTLTAESLTELAFDSDEPDSTPLNSYGDNRPADTAIPDDRTGSLIFVLGDGSLHITPVEITFTLNENYDPTSVARGNELCREFNLSYLIGTTSDRVVYAVAGLAAGGLLGLLLAYYRRQIRRQRLASPEAKPDQVA